MVGDLVTKSCPTLSAPMDCRPPRLLSPWGFLGKNTRVGCHLLLQGIFPTQGSNPGLLHCRQILYRLSHQGGPGSVGGEEPSCRCRRPGRQRFDPWAGSIPWRRRWQPAPVLLLQNPMDRGAWQASVHRVTRSRTQLSNGAPERQELRRRGVRLELMRGQAEGSTPGLGVPLPEDAAAARPCAGVQGEAGRAESRVWPGGCLLPAPSPLRRG